MNPISMKEINDSNELRQTENTENYIERPLETNEKVIARITDGIYRQPGSAIRELMINAYDADATWVSVNTDAPRFSQITIEDNGAGMSANTLVHLLNNIGGSAKRSEQGIELGVTSSEDKTLSPQGRKLIGKLGIGLFSVSQLTYSFQIITKTQGDPYRTIAIVKLKQFSEDGKGDGENDVHNTGTYRAWRELASEKDAHGTTIILNAIKPQARNTLKSKQMWEALIKSCTDESSGVLYAPSFHIGYLGDDELFQQEYSHQKRPWSTSDSSRVFSEMVTTVWAELQKDSNVKLSYIFDNYYQMLWKLALSLPLPYVEKDIFYETLEDDWAYLYKLSNEPRGSAELIDDREEGKTIAELSGIELRQQSNTLPFNVKVDGIELFRPIRYRGLPTTQHVIKKPMIFVGSVREEFLGLSDDIQVGPLDFHAYLLWTPKVAPTEHQGVLVRIHDASGTLFDSTFFNYPISEQTRLRQIVCEIFVDQGLEAALNIDRESFNTAHPHTVYLAQWLHSALRQLATAQKKESQRLRNQVRNEEVSRTQGVYCQIVKSANEHRTQGEGIVPEIRFSAKTTDIPIQQPQEISPNEIVQEFDFYMIVKDIPAAEDWKPSPEGLGKLREIAKVLSVYGLFDDLNKSEQTNLLASILGILEADRIG